MVAWRGFRLMESALLTGIVALAAVLRLAFLPARGLIYWDEGKFALEGVRLEVLVQALVGGHAYLLAGKAVGTAKPTHALLIAISYLVLGVHDYSAILMNAIASTAGVIVVYFIGRRLFGTPVALIGALLLAVSEYDAIYARSVLSESDANLFLLLGIALWLRYAVTEEHGVWKPNLDCVAGALVSSTLIGIAFTANYRIIVYTVAFLGFDWIWVVLNAGRSDRLDSVPGQLGRRVLLCVVGFCLAPIAWEIVGIVVQSRGIDLFHSELSNQTETYLGQVAYQLHGGKQSAFLFHPVLYVQWWILRQGWLLSLVLAGGLILGCWKRTFPWLLTVAMVLAPYCIYVFAPFAVPRNLVASIPFASLICGAAIFTGSHYLRKYAIAFLLVSSLVLGSIGAVMTWRLTAERSGFALAARFITVHAGGRALTSSEVMVFYLRGSGPFCEAPALPYHLRSLAGYERQGFHFAVVDRHHGSPMVDLIEQRSPRAADYSALGALSIGESPISSENSDPPANDAAQEYVDVYRLVRLPGKPAAAPPCRRDQVT